MTKTMSASVSEAEEALKHRRGLYPQYASDFAAAEETYRENLKELREIGYTVLRGFEDPAIIKGIAESFNQHCSKGEDLQLSRDLRNVTDAKDWQQSNRFSDDDMRKGERYLSDKTNFLQSRNPLVAFPSLAGISLDERILDIGGAYLGALPLMSFAKLRKSFSNDLPLFDTELFHIDGNSVNMMKGLLLLSDMTPETGSHDFVTGTHRTLEADGARWTYEETEHKYGKDRIHSVYGKAGDMIIEDTSGLHRAVRPTTGSRTVAIFNYVLHPEYGYDQVGWPKCEITCSTFDCLEQKQKDAAGELEQIDA